jgi:NAD(P) transhydrogenase subunit alpha
MKIVGIAKETNPLETRVAMVPQVASALIKNNWEVLCEEGAGLKAGISDEAYVEAGARVVKKSDLYAQAHVLLAVDAAGLSEASGQIVMGLFDPFFNQAAVKKLMAQNNTLLALELIPRISRAQSMDVLSSQANLAGYVAVVMAASRLNKIMPMMMTAAGTLSPARVLIVGAGVAGLSAIATAKRLGASVFAYDIRPAVREEIESLGAKFVEITVAESGEGEGGYAKALSEQGQAQQRQALTHYAKDMDVIITTAQIPGRKAPKLLDRDLYSLLKPDSVVIDLAAQSGGNTWDVEANVWQKIDNVWLFGGDHLARHVPKDASLTLSKNMAASLGILFNEQGVLNSEDEIIRGALIAERKVWKNDKIAAAFDNQN